MPKLKLQLLRPVFSVLISAALLGTETGCHTRYDEGAGKNLSIKPAVTYFYRLRGTQLSTALTTTQKERLFEHTKGWKPLEISVIATCENAAAEADTGIDYWILFDGRWPREYGGKKVFARHADAGKWFVVFVSNGGNCRLVATVHSYVVRITQSDILSVFRNWLNFATRLEVGLEHY
ncbi:hypothetical protein [Burkholderia gladioli]|uniref:hypothetical protein n=1 Tax=Burkholderia gladioli TaxID=28095 RepID=UPI00202F7A40|nr:hypothetical protein [Burkholderia gladioli]URV28959.1 hypothetical protein NAL90_22480 [Burkholderia gladioli]